MSKILSLILSILLLAGVSYAQTTNQRQNATLATVAFGSVTNAFTDFLTNTAGNAFVSLDILNLTNADITCSFDGGSTAHDVIPAQSSHEVPLGVINRHHASTVECKYTTGAPTSGNVYIIAGY